MHYIKMQKMAGKKQKMIGLLGEVIIIPNPFLTIARMVIKQLQSIFLI